MENDNATNDERSIAPVSSLRSRFEQLTKTNTDLKKPTLPDAYPRSRSVQPAQPSTNHPLTPRTSFGVEAESLSNSIDTLDDPPLPIPSRPAIKGSETAAGGGHVNVVANEDGLNRAAGPQPAQKKAVKPAVPTKRPDLTRRTTGDLLNSPQNVTDNQEQGTSVGVTTEKQAEDATVPLRARLSSDASWVERLHDRHNTSDHPVNGIDSDENLVNTSSVRETRGSLQDVFANRPTRVGSDASWVENLSSTPPSAVNREYRHDLSSRASYLQSSSGRRTSPDKSSSSPQRRDASTKPGRADRTSPTTQSASVLSTSATEGVDHVVDASNQPSKTSVTETFNPKQSSSNEMKPSMPNNNALPSKKGLMPPAIPPPRRSVDRRPAKSELDPSDIEQSDDGRALASNEPIPSGMFPDASAANRRPPRLPRPPWKISTGYDTRLLACDGGLICTSGLISRVWYMQTGKLILDMPHQEAIKVTAISITCDTSTAELWLGTSMGDLHKIDIYTGTTVKSCMRAHRGREIVRVFVHGASLWSLDEAGELNVWSTNDITQPSITHRIQRGPAVSLAHRGLLWLATGKEVRVYSPVAVNDSDFYLTQQPLSQPNLGDVSAGVVLPHQQDRIYFGHTDGKISIYDARRLELIAVVHVSLSKISALAAVGDQLWAGYGTGNITIYDTAQPVWRVLKDWPAHEKQVCAIVSDQSLFKDTNNITVVSLAFDNVLKLWDGLLKTDWIDSRLRQEDSRYSTFDEIKLSVLTWNVGASKPSHLQTMINDEDQLVEYLRQRSGDDMLVFGFQELVDLDDKKLTAKTIFKSKKKDPNDQERITHQYRAWRDYLTRLLFQRKGDQFVLLNSACLVGLFCCVFVRTALRPRIKHVQQTEIKRGMGGHYGNKGALVLRMIIDDSSVCLLNCHLAAGQTQTSSRNNDVAAILDSSCFSAPMLSDLEPDDIFAGGGDGSMILDHEIVILNGDLNYRIDTMSRETVIKYVQQGNISRLLDRDQLRLSKKKNPSFRLRVFNENEIRFAPTYKYDVNTDTYDTSEKQRSPAWCDRVLYRGVKKLACDEYRRWEIRISDHRPVSASFRCRVKTIDVARRERVIDECIQAFDLYIQNLQARIVK